MFPDFGAMEKLGKDLVTFMSDVNLKLDEIKNNQVTLDNKLKFIVSVLTLPLKDESK